MTPTLVNKASLPSHQSGSYRQQALLSNDKSNLGAGESSEPARAMRCRPVPLGSLLRSQRTRVCTCTAKNQQPTMRALQGAGYNQA